MFKDLFISYGRRESLGFVARLHQKLKLASYDAWFDKVNIPDGEDYAARINHGIESAHNFVYVMAPRALCSPYCLIEIEYARVLGKRVIPINQMVIFQAGDCELSAGDQQVLHGFYAAHGIDDPNITTVQQVLDRSLAVVGRTDWLDGKEKLSDDDCAELAAWAQGYENHWHKHDDPDYLQTVELPPFGASVDSLDSIVERMHLVLERHKTYVEQHTDILRQALAWANNQHANHYLLVGKERTAAEDWLHREFRDGEQPPCVPNDLICDFICEARKNAENRMTDCFVCYDHTDKAVRDAVVRSLARYAVTTWRHDSDIAKGRVYEQAIEEGIEGADNFLFFISPAAVWSEYCRKELEHALKYHKRIIPLLIVGTTEEEIPAEINTLQYIDFTDNQNQADYDSDIADILNILRQDREYHEHHKILLVRALKWQDQNQKSSFLLRGHNLENAKTWLRLNERRTQYPPLTLHRELIERSEAAKGGLGSEVFISYSRKDGDFARRLNLALQEAGKTVWFDQESIASGVDFEAELYKGIDSADNFVFLVSPDSVESPYCEDEVNYADSQGKRLLSVLVRETDPQSLPEPLRVINWIDFADQPFDKQFAELVQAIDLDRDYVRQHTQLQQRAMEWQENKWSENFLLNRPACEKAEIWRDSALAEKKQPPPTHVQQAFVRQSRNAISAVEQREKRRQRTVLGIVLAGLMVALGLAVFAWIQMEKAINAQNKAISQAKYSKAVLLGSQSMLAAYLPNASNGFFDRALLLGIQSIEILPSWEMTGYLANVYQVQPRIIQYLRGPDAYVHSVAFTPDGLGLAGSGGDTRILWWDLTRLDQPPTLLAQHKEPVKSLAFSPDGRFCVTGGNNGEFRLWDLATSPPVSLFLEGYNGTVYSVVFSPDGRLLAGAGMQSRLLIWDVSTWPPAGRALTGHSSTLYSVAFTPDGALLAGGGGNEHLRLWNVASGQGMDLFRGESSKVIYSIAFSPDGQLLAAGGSDNLVHLWAAVPTPEAVESEETADPAVPEWQGKLRYEPVAELAGHSDVVYSLAFSPDGQRLVSSGRDKTLRVWDVNNRRLLEGPLYGHNDRIRSVAFSPNGMLLASAGYDNAVLLWNMEPQPSRSKIVGRQDTPIHSLALNPNGNLLASAGEDTRIRLWDLTAVRAGENTQIRLWNLTIGRPSENILQGHKKTVSTLAFSPNRNLLASTGFDNTVRLWDLDQPAPTGMVLGSHTQEAYALVFSPDGKLLASAGADMDIRLWDTATRTPVGMPLRGHSKQIRNLQFSPDGRYLASAGYDAKVILWDVTNRQPAGLPLGKHTDKVRALAFSPDSKFLAGGGDDAQVWLWQPGLPKSKAMLLMGLRDHVSVVAFSPDSKLLVGADREGTVMLWDLTDLETIGHSLPGHSKAVEDLVFTPDGTMFATASQDKTIILWDVAKQMPVLQPLEGHESPVTKLLLSHDGKILFSADRSGAILWWTLNIKLFTKHACRISGRNMTKKEWARYMGEDVPYQKTCF